MEDFPLLSCWPAGGTTFSNTTVHIPFNIGNIGSAKDLVDGKQAPEVCPVCNHPQSYFQIEAQNY